MFKCCHSQPFNLPAINHRTTFTNPKCSNPLCQTERAHPEPNKYILGRAACQTKCKLGKTMCEGNLPPAIRILCGACILATLRQNICAHESEIDAGQLIRLHRYLLYTNVRANGHNYWRNYRRTAANVASDAFLRLSALIDEFLGDQCNL